MQATRECRACAYAREDVDLIESGVWRWKRVTERTTLLCLRFGARGMACSQARGRWEYTGLAPGGGLWAPGPCGLTGTEWIARDADA